MGLKRCLKVSQKRWLGWCFRRSIWTWQPSKSIWAYAITWLQSWRKSKNAFP